MTDTASGVEDTDKSFTVDGADHMRAALDKGTKSVSELATFATENIAALVASGRAAGKGVEDFAKYAGEYARASLEKANASSKQLAAAKSPAEFFQIQSEMAKSSISAFVAEASKFGDSYLKVIDEIGQPIQQRYEVAAEKAKAAIAV